MSLLLYLTSHLTKLGNTYNYYVQCPFMGTGATCNLCHIKLKLVCNQNLQNPLIYDSIKSDYSSRLGNTGNLLLCGYTEIVKIFTV